MAKKEYVYSTSELAAYYGLTRKGLSFYEEKGIIAPAREENGKYRVYSLSDCYHLYHTKLYENMGYTLAEAARIMETDTAADVVEHLRAHALLMKSRLERQQRIIERAEYMARVLERSIGGRFCDIVTSPGWYRLFVRTYQEEHTSTPSETSEFARWKACIPLNVASLRYDCARLLAGDEWLNVNIGSMMEAADSERFGFEKSDRIEYIPPRKCLYTVITGDAERINHSDWMQPALDALNRMDLRLTADPITALLAVTQENGRTIRRDELWLPID